MYVYNPYGKYYGGYSLREAEDPNNAAADDGGEEAAPAEDTAPATDDGGSEEESPDTGTDDTGEEDTGDEDNPDNGDENFNIDTTDDTRDGEEGGDTEGEEDPNSEDSGDDSTDDEESEEESNVMKALDAKLYADLSPTEQKAKIREQKNLFTELHARAGNLADKLNAVVVSDQDANLQVKSVSSMLFNLKQMIYDYFVNIYGSKSYQENDIMFNRYLDMLNQVKGFVKDLKKDFFSDSE